jgi:choline dehydrogenase
MIHILKYALDPNAVLDNNFSVRGVDRLRVVDLSSWPKVPGYFVTTPTYMVSFGWVVFDGFLSELQMSEKAADVIIDAAKKRRL